MRLFRLSRFRLSRFLETAASFVTHLIVIAVLAPRLNVVILLRMRTSCSRLEAVVVVQRPRAGVPGS